MKTRRRRETEKREMRPGENHLRIGEIVRNTSLYECCALIIKGKTAADWLYAEVIRGRR